MLTQIQILAFPLNAVTWDEALPPSPSPSSHTQSLYFSNIIYNNIIMRYYTYERFRKYGFSKTEGINMNIGLGIR